MENSTCTLYTSVLTIKSNVDEVCSHETLRDGELYHLYSMYIHPCRYRRVLHNIGLAFT